MEEKGRLFQIFPERIKKALEAAFPEEGKMEEIRLRPSSPLLFLACGREYRAGGEDFLVRREEVEETLQRAARFSLYAFAEELRQGYFTVQGGHRIGVAGRVILEQGRIRTIHPVTFLNIRIAHQVIGCADAVLPFLLERETGKIRNTLLISPPRCGKTTLLRDIIRQVSDGTGRKTAGIGRAGCDVGVADGNRAGCSVGVADERSEIAACYQGIPQNDVGCRTDVLDGCPKALGMMMLIRSMAPEVVAADEIGGAADLEALRYVMNCGCRILATVHGTSVEDLKKKPGLSEFLEEGRFERYLVLGNRHGPGTVEGITDAEGQGLWLEKKENTNGGKLSCG